MEHVARLEVECWLDPADKDRVNARAQSVHAALLSAVRRRRPSKEIVGLINAMSKRAIDGCVNALQIVQDAGLTYCTNGVDFDGSPLVYAERFSQTIGGDPLSAFLRMRALRCETVQDQVSALLLEAAQAQEERASWWPAGGLPLTFKGRPVTATSPPVGEQIAPTPQGRGPSAAELEGRALAQTKRDVAVAKRARRVLESRTPIKLWRTCAKIRGYLQDAREGCAPAAIMIPSAATSAECQAIASAYENLHSDLPGLGRWKIKGKKRRLAIDAWPELASWAQVFRVLGGWIRALGRAPALPLCPLCYRHRATKKHCGEHVAKSGITPAIRLARAIGPAYVEMASRLSRDGNTQVGPVDEWDWRQFEPFARECKVPETLHRQCCILAVHLRRLYPRFGPSRAKEASGLFEQLFLRATELYEERALNATTAGASTASATPPDFLLNLRTFFVFWWASADGRPYPRTAPKICGRGHDSYHPLVQGKTASVASSLSDGLVRQQAWDLVLKAHHDRLGNAKEVAKLRAQDLSYDEIGAKYGYSHETARRIEKRGNQQRLRARLKPYSAKGRLKPSGSQS